MSTLTWIIIAGVAMSALALSGSLTLILPDRVFNRVVHPLVAVAVLIPFAAGNVIDIALADLVPELTTTPEAHEKIIHTVGVAAGLALLFAVAVMR